MEGALHLIRYEFIKLQANAHTSLDLSLSSVGVLYIASTSGISQNILLSRVDQEFTAHLQNYKYYQTFQVPSGAMCEPGNVSWVAPAK